MSRYSAFACLMVTLALPAGPVAAKSYGETLLARLARRHRAVTAIAVTATDAQGKPITPAWGTPKRAPSSIALTNGLGDGVGTVAVESAHRGDAAAIALEMAHRMYAIGVLAEPDPAAPGATRSRLGQALVERLADREPGLVTLALHVALPGRENQIIASNFGRIGKAADKDDAHVIADGATLREVTNGGRRLAVELPLLDRAGRTIGALSTSFLIDAGRDQDSAYRQAVALRDGLALKIASVEALAMPE